MGAVSTKAINKVDKKWSTITKWTSKTYRIDSIEPGLKTTLIDICLGFEIFFTIQKLYTCTVIELYGKKESSFKFISAELELFIKAYSIPVPICEINKQIRLPENLSFNEDNPGWQKETKPARRTASSGTLKKCCQQIAASSPKAIHTKISKGMGSGSPVSLKFETGKSTTVEKSYIGHFANDDRFRWKVDLVSQINHTCQLRSIGSLNDFIEQVAKFTGNPELKYSTHSIFVEGIESEKRPILTITQLVTLLDENRENNEYLTAQGMKTKTLTFKVQPFNKTHEKIECLWLSPTSKLRSW